MNSIYKASFNTLYEACERSKVKTSLVILMTPEMLQTLVNAHRELTGKTITKPKLMDIEIYETHSLPHGREWVFALNN